MMKIISSESGKVFKMDLEWKICENCGFLQHPTHVRCLKCKSQKFYYEKAKGDATLLAYTTLTAPPAEFRNKPSYTLGVVEFENGVKALSQIEFEGKLDLGMKMKLFQSKICDNLDGKEIVDYIFKPLR
jgi:uncharacterized OB-fold protein